MLMVSFKVLMAGNAPLDFAMLRRPVRLAAAARRNGGVMSFLEGRKNPAAAVPRRGSC
jgi:hypothetical protein